MSGEKNSIVTRLAWILVGVALTLGALKGNDFYTRHMARQAATTYLQARFDNDVKTLREVTTPEYFGQIQTTTGWMNALRTFVGAKAPELIGVADVRVLDDGTVHVFMDFKVGESSRREGAVVRKDAEGTWRVSGTVR